MLDFLGITAVPLGIPTLREQLRTLRTRDAVKPADTADVKTKPKSRVKIKEELTGVLPPTRYSRAAAPEPQGSRAPEPEKAASQVLPGDIKSDELNVPEEFVAQEVVTPPKEALELKEKVIDALQAAFRAGKSRKSARC